MTPVEVYPSDLDWPTVMGDMSARGMTYYAQARAIGVRHSTYDHWRRFRGKPQHAYGEAILELHAKVCGHELTILRRQEGAPRL